MQTAYILIKTFKGGLRIIGSMVSSVNKVRISLKLSRILLVEEEEAEAEEVLACSADVAAEAVSLAAESLSSFIVFNEGSSTLVGIANSHSLIEARCMI